MYIGKYISDGGYVYTESVMEEMMKQAHIRLLSEFSTDFDLIAFLETQVSMGPKSNIQISKNR